MLENREQKLEAQDLGLYLERARRALLLPRGRPHAQLAERAEEEVGVLV
jgi:hypothetical protein